VESSGEKKKDRDDKIVNQSNRPEKNFGRIRKCQGEVRKIDRKVKKYSKQKERSASPPGKPKRGGYRIGKLSIIKGLNRGKLNHGEGCGKKHRPSRPSAITGQKVPRKEKYNSMKKKDRIEKGK